LDLVRQTRRRLRPQSMPEINGSTLEELRALRASKKGYPDVPFPKFRTWGDADYKPTFYVHEAIKSINPDWNKPNVEQVWKRARLLAPGLNLEADGLTGLPRNPAGPTGITGLGELYNFGPNVTADSIVKWNDYILLIIRGDTGQMAFPGGFRDPLDDSKMNYEDPETAARREAKEETGLPLPEDIMPQQVYCGAPPWSLRNTDVAWIYNWAGLFDISKHFNALPKVKGGDDAADAKWIKISDVTPALMSVSHADNFWRVLKMIHQG
jgi:ADP-ribose pyrophosphatase YjhB (NUDIX family)